ncbi:ABC transporter ATP-binding protein uup, partial [Haemophilus influenzae]
MATRIVDLD